MPRIVNLLPCERVIVDRDGIPSLLSLFQNIQIEPSEGQGITEVPPNTITFKEWAVYSEWMADAQDVGLDASQILEVQYPDGSIAPIRGSIPFKFEKTGIQRNHQNIIGFPVGQEGTYTIRVWLELDGKAISEIGTYEMTVSHKISPGTQSRELLGAPIIS
jgi:hypothetical protein